MEDIWLEQFYVKQFKIKLQVKRDNCLRVRVIRIEKCLDESVFLESNLVALMDSHALLANRILEVSNREKIVS